MISMKTTLRHDLPPMPAADRKAILQMLAVLRLPGEPNTASRHTLRKTARAAMAAGCALPYSVRCYLGNDIDINDAGDYEPVEVKGAK